MSYAMALLVLPTLMNNMAHSPDYAKSGRRINIKDLTNHQPCATR